METTPYRQLPESKPAEMTWSADMLDRAESLSHSDKDEFGFSFETIGGFSDSPLVFEEYAEALMDDLEDIYYLTQIDNRFSPNYLSACETMDKIVRLLASCCVTKAVLEQKGFSFPKLERLTADGLFGCLSFNFRKCHAAIKEGRQKNILDYRLLKMECRLYELSERLKSTGEKIRMIRSGKIKADAMLERTLVFKTAAQEKKPDFRFPSGTRAPVSFPVLGSVAREMVRREKEAAPAAVSGSAQPFRLTRPFSPIAPEQVEKSHAKVKAQLSHKEDAAEKSKPKEAWSTDEERDKIIRAGWERLAKLATPKNRTAAEDPKSEPSRSQPKKRKKRKRA